MAYQDTGIASSEPAALLGQQVDVTVIGAGVAGASAASALAATGLSVALVDFRDSHPPDFRAEKISEPQVAFFDSFGLGAAARGQLTAFDGVWLHRFGRIVEKGSEREYSSPYGDLVNALRDALPTGIHKIVGRVTDLRVTSERQEVELSDGRVIASQLLAVATGLGEAIKTRLGIERIVTSRTHSLVAGFDLSNPLSDFPFASLVWVTEKAVDKTAYLTLFPMGGKMRANLFLYRTADDPWCVQLRRDPTTALRTLLPGFEREFRPMVVDGPVQLRPIDIAMANQHRQAGVVLIGDAFFTSCPASGTGMHKALNDVDRLRHLAPQWFVTPGMSREKIEQFYDDPTKREVDAASLHLSLHERAVRMDNSLSGSLLRLRRNVLRRGAYHVRDLLGKRPSPQLSGH